MRALAQKILDALAATDRFDYPDGDGRTRTAEA
jgi:hypothetical protein